MCVYTKQGQIFHSASYYFTCVERLTVLRYSHQLQNGNEGYVTGYRGDKVCACTLLRVKVPVLTMTTSNAHAP